MDDHRTDAEPRYGFGSFSLEPQGRRLVCNDAPVTLGPKLFDLLWLLVREQGGLVPRARVVEALWPGVAVSDTNLRQKVWLLRGLLRAADPTGGDYVETVPRQGYRLAVPVTQEPAPHAPTPADPVDVPSLPARRDGATTAGRASMLLAAVPLLLGFMVAAPHGLMLTAAHGPAAVAPGAARSVTVLRLMSHSSHDQDGWLASAFTEILRAELAAAAGLHLIPVEAAERVSAELSPAPARGLSKDSLVWVRKALGTDLVVAGSLVAAGPGPEAPLRVELLVQCTRSRRVLAAVTRSGARRDLPALASRTAREVLRALGAANTATIG